MFRQFAIVAGVCLASTAAFAQEAAAPAEAPAATTEAPAAAPEGQLPAGVDPAMAFEAANNQLGILKFCEAQGHTGAEAVAAQEKMIGMLPAGDAEKATAAAAKGEEGTVVVGGTEISLEDAATQQGTTVEAQCQQIEAAVNQVAAQLPG